MTPPRTAGTTFVNDGARFSFDADAAVDIVGPTKISAWHEPSAVAIGPVVAAEWVTVHVVPSVDRSRYSVPAASRNLTHIGVVETLNVAAVFDPPQFAP